MLPPLLCVVVPFPLGGGWTPGAKVGLSVNVAIRARDQPWVEIGKDFRATRSRPERPSDPFRSLRLTMQPQTRTPPHLSREIMTRRDTRKAVHNAQDSYVAPPPDGPLR
jgi:hypothetical protein